MKVVVFGAGYVGLVQALGLTSFGNHVVVIDSNREKISSLRNSIVPFHEPGLPELLRDALQHGHFEAFENGDARIPEALKAAEVIFISVGTPELAGGSADLTYVDQVVESLLKFGSSGSSKKVVAIKSTVPVGTGDIIQQKFDAQEKPFMVASNPEFLKQGNALTDFLRPDRIIVGAQEPEAFEILRQLYRPLMMKKSRLIKMDRRSAELTKYACNTFLATKISFINELAELSEILGTDIRSIREGMISDPRIGEQFLYPGVGFGGSCLPKDTNALIQLSEGLDRPMKILKAVQAVNDNQKRWAIRRLEESWGKSWKSKRVGIWGLSFKAGTDDLREATSLVVLNEIHLRGAEIIAYDPLIKSEGFSKWSPVPLQFRDTSYAAAEGVDALIVLTEYSGFRNPDWNEIKKNMRDFWVLDGRNLYDRDQLEKLGFRYSGVGISSRNATA